MDFIQADGSAELRVNCPHCAYRGHSPDIHHKLYVNTEKGVGFCQRCGWRGAATDILLEVFGPSALVNLLTTAIMPRQEPVKPSYEMLDFDGITYPMTKYSYRALDYLKSRPTPLSLEDALRFDIRPGKGQFSDRVLIPSYTEHGDCCYVTARSMVNSEMKYLYPKGYHKSYSVWGVTFIPDGCVTAIVCEGVFSAIALRLKMERAGVMNVATLAVGGKMIAKTQAEIIHKLGLPVTVMFDADCTTEELQRAASILRSMGTQTHVARLLQGDPDETPAQDLLQQLTQPINLLNP